MPGTDSLYDHLLGHRSIRLLKLLPGNDGDPVQGTLHEHDLDNVPEFETVSYVWGDPSIRQSITCNGVILLVTQSLHDALSQFRLTSESRLLWTDAICINQGDLDERASQVMIMHDIYRLSKKCLVWLGRADEDSAAAFQIIRDIATVLCREKGIPVEEIDRDLDENGRDLMLTQRVRFDGLPPPDSPSWTSLFRFFGRPWFTRIWVSHPSRTCLVFPNYQAGNPGAILCPWLPLLLRRRPNHLCPPLPRNPLDPRQRSAARQEAPHEHGQRLQELELESQHHTRRQTRRPKGPVRRPAALRRQGVQCDGPEGQSLCADELSDVWE